MKDKVLNKIADTLEGALIGTANLAELVVSDLTSTKQLRRRATTKKIATMQTRKHSRRQQVPVVIINVIKKAE